VLTGPLIAYESLPPAARSHARPVAVRPAGRLVDPLDRRILALAVPALAALLVEPLYNLTDSAIVGHLGRTPLGGLAVAGAFLNIVGWTSAFVEMATVSLVAFRRGAGDDAGAGRAVGAAYVVSLALGVAAALVVGLIAPFAVGALGAHGLVAHDAVTYLRISAVGLVPLLVSLAGNGHLVGLADTRRPFVIALAANVVNVVLEVLLVYVAHAGIAGSAWGTVAAQFVSAALFVIASRRAKVRPSRPVGADLRRLARDGGRLTVRTAALGFALLASTAIAARLGTAQLAGHQIALQVWLLLALTLDALAVPAQVYVGDALGRDDLPHAVEVGRRVLRMGVVGGVAVGALTVAFAWLLPAVFSNDAGVQRQATLALVVCGTLQPAAALAFVLDGLVLGASGYRALQWTMVGALGAFAPLAVLTLARHSTGLAGVWLAIACWLVFRAVALGWWWRRRTHRPPAVAPSATAA
jgi:putative MATE family efflux protein